MIKRLFKHTTILIIVVLIFFSITFSACSDEPKSEAELRAKVYNEFIKSFENPVNKYYDYVIQYVIKEIVTMSVKSFIPNTELGLGIKFTDSLYGLFSLRDVREIEKVNKKNAEALGLTSAWEELIMPFYWEEGAVSKILEEEISKNYYDKFGYTGHKSVYQFDYGANNLIHELKFMEHMCNLELGNEDRLLEVLYGEIQFLEEHLKSLVTEQMANGIKEELRYYNDNELSDAKIFYRNNVELLGAFVLSDINYLNEKISELEFELGIETGTATEKVDLGTGKEDEKIELEAIEEEIEDGEEDSEEINKKIVIIEKAYDEINEEEKYEIHIKYPQIDGFKDKEKQRIINNELDDLINNNIYSFREALKDYEEDYEDLDLDPEFYVAGFKTINYDVYFVSEELVSIVFEISTYYPGMAHDFICLIPYNIDCKKNSQIFMHQLFKPDSNYISFISEYCINDLKKRNIAEEMYTTDWEIEYGAGPEEKNFGIFALNEKGIIIFFQPYQVACWAAGTIKVEISYEEIGHFLEFDLSIIN